MIELVEQYPDTTEADWDDTPPGRPRRYFWHVHRLAAEKARADAQRRTR